jgi:hypothetical protein
MQQAERLEIKVLKHPENVKKAEQEKAKSVADAIEPLVWIFQQRYLLNGWRPMPAEDAIIAAQAWADVLVRHNVPPAAFREIFYRVLDVQATSIANGTPQEWSVQLFLAVWKSQRQEILQKLNKDGKALPERTSAANPTCSDCYGTGVHIIKDKGARVCKACFPDGK